MRQQGSGRGTLGNLATGRKGWNVIGRHTAGDAFAHRAGSGAETLLPVEGRFAVAVPEVTPLPAAGKAGTIGKEDTREESYVLVSHPGVRTGLSSGVVLPGEGRVWRVDRGASTA